jgi:hypothetical protein
VLILGVASVAACAAAFMWWKAPAASAQVVASPEAVFVTRCNYSHTNFDDPIVHADKPGAAHSHDFFGNRSTDFASTYQSLRALEGPTPATKSGTTCVNAADKSAYWIPTMSWTNKKGPQTQHGPLLLSIGRQGGCRALPARIEGGSKHARQLEVRAGDGCYTIPADAVLQRQTSGDHPLPRLPR